MYCLPERLFAFAAIVTATYATCPSQLQPANGVNPSVASGYTWALVATGLASPRSLQFDHIDKKVLWVLEAGKGVSRHTVADGGGVCVGLEDSTTIIEDSSLTHGLIVDRTRIIASSVDTVYQVLRDAEGANLNSKKTLVTNMTGTDHVTRTLLMAAGTNNSLIVSRGSFDNFDPEAAINGTGHSTIKMFNIGNKAHATPYNYDTSGTLLGWGLRNDVGIAQHPATGGLYAVENSVDQLLRNGVDVHENNPGEELNYLGVVDPTNMTSFAANYYGYPNCFSAWDPKELPAHKNLHVGSPFAQDSENDTACLKTEPARLTFQAHTAPLDIKFNNTGQQAWVSFHGSWDRDPPVGYGVAIIDFDSDGKPVAPSTSSTAANYIFGNADLSVCPGSCFRPVGLAFDKQGRLWITSDATGEIYVLMKNTAAKTPALRFRG